ncbi:hypothetical protein HN587_02015 [Candidatus Woesearchaeota archaeon]|jgi:hypothetical protein|nr:hypothetical protein [Candidatus Woesearchaeota archaeon]
MSDLEELIEGEVRQVPRKKFSETLVGSAIIKWGTAIGLGWMPRDILVDSQDINRNEAYQLNTIHGITELVAGIGLCGAAIIPGLWYLAIPGGLMVVESGIRKAISSDLGEGYTRPVGSFVVGLPSAAIMLTVGFPVVGISRAYNSVKNYFAQKKETAINRARQTYSDVASIVLAEDKISDLKKYFKSSNLKQSLDDGIKKLADIYLEKIIGGGVKTVFYLNELKTCAPDQLKKIYSLALAGLKYEKRTKAKHYKKLNLIYEKIRKEFGEIKDGVGVKIENRFNQLVRRATTRRDTYL